MGWPTAGFWALATGDTGSEREDSVAHPPNATTTATATIPSAYVFDIFILFFLFVETTETPIASAGKFQNCAVT
ncbi:hypothetical protein [Paraburkholderia atlantica]|uniref:hypothetical protein n=1 Tax=Paraburkholderia atlantica TaxID=2654982 RepID=UPI0017BD8A2F|nr:hypothetical protein [Paraburkholderia atlantica]MBB5418035.1 hypothetical protein [Paraburkholderia atlantica]